MTNDKKDIGRRIRQIRNGLGLNQTEFGDHLGVVASSVSAYEKGETSPSFEMVAKIAKLGHISIDDLLTGGTESAPAYPDMYDIIKGEEEAGGTIPSGTNFGGDSPEMSSALSSLFASVDLIKKKLVSKEGRSGNALKEAFTGEVVLTDEDRRLLTAFHKLDEKRRTRLIEDAEDMVLALGNRK